MKYFSFLLLAGTLALAPVHVSGMTTRGGEAETGKEEKSRDKKLDPAATKARTEEEQIKVAQAASLRGPGNPEAENNREVVEEETIVVSKEDKDLEENKNFSDLPLSQKKSTSEASFENVASLKPSEPFSKEDLSTKNNGMKISSDLQRTSPSVLSAEEKKVSDKVLNEEQPKEAMLAEIKKKAATLRTALSPLGATEEKRQIKKVTFDPALSEKEEVTKEKAILAESDKKFKKNIKKLKFLITELEIAIDDIPEEDSERFGKAAAMCRTAYPKIKETFKTLLASIDPNELVQNKNNALVLGRMAVEVLEIAFKALDREKMRPLLFLKESDDAIIKNRGIVTEKVSSETPAMMTDKEAELAIYAADYAIKDLCAFMTLLTTDPNKMEEECYQVRFRMAARASVYAQKQESKIALQQAALSQREPSEELKQECEALNIAAATAQANAKQCIEIFKKLLILDSESKKKVASETTSNEMISSLVSLVFRTIDLSDNLIDACSEINSNTY